MTWEFDTPKRQYKWQQRRNRKSRKSKDRPSAAVRATVLARDGQRCTLCQKPLKHEEVTLDHIVEKRNGGKATVDNLRVACKRCNNARSNPKTVSRAMKTVLGRLKRRAALVEALAQGGPK